MGPIIIIVVLALLGWLAAWAALPVMLAWILTAVFGTLSSLLILGNPIAGLIAQRRKKNYSFVPFFGGVFGVLSLLFCPIHGARYFAWVPLILDLTFPMFLYSVFVLGAFRTHPKNDDRGEFDTNTRNCPNCGRENSIHTRVCPRCGTKVDASREPSNITDIPASPYPTPKEPERELPLAVGRRTRPGLILTAFIWAVVLAFAQPMLAVREHLRTGLPLEFQGITTVITGFALIGLACSVSGWRHLLVAPLWLILVFLQYVALTWPNIPWQR